MSHEFESEEERRHHHDGEVCHCHDHDHHHHDHGGGGCEHCEANLHGEEQAEYGTLIRACVAAVLLAALMIVFRVVAPELPFIVPLLLYLVPYLLVGYDVLWGALRNIARGRVFDEQFLMSAATIGAFALGEYPEGVAVMLFYQLGEFFQTLAVGKSRRSIAALMDIRPDSATVLRDGKEITVEPEEVEVGEILVVRPGEKIPLDGVIIEGESTIDNAALTGESLPQSCGVGSVVFGGSVNMSGVIRVEAQSRYHDSTVAKILELVEHSAEKKAKVENFITRFARIYTPVVVFCAAVLALLPPLVTGQPFAGWIHRALVFLVVSCPCALVISVPLSFFGGVGGASRQGILIKGAGRMEQLSRVDTVVFDKTGTLTKGRFTVSDICPNTVSGAELLTIAASLERYSDHPIAYSIVEACPHPLFAPEKVREIAGKGVCAESPAGDPLAVGSAALMRERGVEIPAVTADGTAVHVAKGATWLGYLVIRDELKPDLPTVMNALARCDVTKTVMLTGDNAATAARVGKEAGVDEIHSELLPHQKVERVEALLADERCVAFVGDGINDAPVLARADVGVAMGGIGSDAAIESADVVLMDDDLAKLPAAVSIAKKTMRIVRENIAFALAVKAVILVLGALDLVNMWIAVFGDVGVMLLAVLNAMRAMFPPRKK